MNSVLGVFNTLAWAIGWAFLIVLAVATLVLCAALLSAWRRWR
jgi:hypothetical protein